MEIKKEIRNCNTDEVPANQQGAINIVPTPKEQILKNNAIAREKHRHLYGRYGRGKIGSFISG